MLDNNFYIVLPSNVQPEFHPENTASSYRTTFDRSYDLSNGPWEVGLVQMTFVNSLNNIVNESLSFRVQEGARNSKITLRKDKDRHFRSDKTIIFMYNERTHRYSLTNTMADPQAEYQLDMRIARKLGFATNEEMKDRSYVARQYIVTKRRPAHITKHDLYDMRMNYFFKFPENGIITAKEPPIFSNKFKLYEEPVEDFKIYEVVTHEKQPAVRKDIQLRLDPTDSYVNGRFMIGASGTTQRYFIENREANSTAEYKISSDFLIKMGFANNTEFYTKSENEKDRFFKIPASGIIEAKDIRKSELPLQQNVTVEEYIPEFTPPPTKNMLNVVKDQSQSFKHDEFSVEYDESKHRYTLKTPTVKPNAEYHFNENIMKTLGFADNREMRSKKRVADHYERVGVYPPGMTRMDVEIMKTHTYFKFPENGRIEAQQPPLFENPAHKLPEQITLTEKVAAKVSKESSITLAPAYYSKPEELAARLNGEETSLEQKLNPNAAKKKKANRSYFIEFDKHENRFKVAIEAKGELHLENGLHEILGFKERILTKETQFADFPPLMNRGIYNFFIYCDICTPTQVGNVQTPLLQTVEVEGGKRWGLPQTIRFIKPMYVPVSTTMMNSIKIEIRDDAGQVVNFASGKTNLVLHFRQRS
jgi:hypothetical protein